MSACSRLLLLSFLGLYLTLAREVRADDSCLELRVLSDDENLHWIRKTYVLDVPKAETVRSIDWDGNRKKEIILKNQDGKIRLLSISPEREISLRLVENLPPPPPTARLDVFAPPTGFKDRLAWVSDFSLLSFPLPSAEEPPPAVELINLDPMDFFRFSRNGISWRCDTRNHLSLKSDLARTYPLCPNCFVATCLHFDARMNVDSRTFDIFAETTSDEGPADIAGDGIQSYLVSIKNHSSWWQMSLGKPVAPWAEFPSKIRWQHSVIGDFNGDNRSDIIVLAEIFRAAWIASSEGSYAVERAIENPFSPKTKLGTLVVGDFDGNGVDDIADFADRNGKLEIEIAFREAPKPSTLNINLFVFRTISPLPLLDMPWWFERQEVIPVSGRKEICDFAKEKYFLGIGPEWGALSFDLLSFAEARTKSRTFFSRSRELHRNSIGGISDFLGARRDPAVCLGYYPQTQFPRFGKWGKELDVCPAGYAVFGAEEGERNGKFQFAVEASCCPLPSTDILTNEHVVVEEACPNDFIMTGTIAFDPTCLDCPLKNRCTKINTERFQLSAPRPGRYWGNGFSGRGQKERLQASDIPIAIRFGITRNNYTDWSTDGCVGDPMGSLLTKRVGKKCNDSEYRELLYRGSAGDPPAGTPVIMFPKCRKIENVFDPRSGCFPEK